MKGRHVHEVPVEFQEVPEKRETVKFVVTRSLSLSGESVDPSVLFLMLLRSTSVECHLYINFGFYLQTTIFGDSKPPVNNDVVLVRVRLTMSTLLFTQLLSSPFYCDFPGVPFVSDLSFGEDVTREGVSLGTSERDDRLSPKVR